MSSAVPITTGTNTAETRSARRWIGACDACASRISRMTCASTLLAPTAVVSISNAPERLIVAPTTRSPASLSTASDSPVSIDSSTAPVPATMRPSTGIRSPGRTITSSPVRTSAMGTSTSVSPRRTRATAGCSRASCRSADIVCILARASSA